MDGLAELDAFEQTKNNAEVNTAIYLLLGNIEKARTCYK